VGHSLQHAGNVPLVYNPATTHVSPQYHVTFDDSFSTVTGATATLSDEAYQHLYANTDWIYKPSFGNSSAVHLFDSYWSNKHNDSLPPVMSCSSRLNPDRKSRPASPPQTLQQTTPCPIPSGGLSFPGEQAMHLAGDQALHPTGDQALLLAGEQASHPAGDHAAHRTVPSLGNSALLASQPFDPCIDVCTLPPTGSSSLASAACLPMSLTGQTVPNRDKLPYVNLRPVACSAALSQYQRIEGIAANVYTVHPSNPYANVSLPSVLPDVDALPFTHLFSYLADSLDLDPPEATTPLADNKNDTLTQGEMLKAPDRDKFVQCQQDEVQSLRDLDIMDVLPIQTLPPRVRLLNSIWSYRRKRLPNGVLSKYKSRLCVNGKEQAFGRNYWETYAPVAAWSTIRLLLYLSTVMNLKTRQVDYTSAFPQVDLDVPVYMRIPQGWYFRGQSPSPLTGMFFFYVYFYVLVSCL